MGDAMKINKRGSSTLGMIIFVAIMIVSLQFLSLITTQGQTVARHQEQTTDIYTYGSVAEILTRGVQQSFTEYRVSIPKTMLSGTDVYQQLCQDLSGKFIEGLDEYVLYTPEQLLQQNSGGNETVAAFVRDLLDDRSFTMTVRVEDLFVPDLYSPDNVLNFTTGDKLYFKPYRIAIQVQGVSTSVKRVWEVRGVYADISVSDTTVTLTPNFSKMVMRVRESLYS